MALTDGNTNTVMPVAPMTGGFGGNSGGMWGGDWSAWIVLFLIFGMFGFGGWGNGGGWGGNGGGMNTAIPFYSQSNDFSNLERENDIIRGDICTNFANVNQTLATGFQGIQTSFAQAELSRSNTQAALMGQMYANSLANQQQASDNAMAMMQGFNTSTNATTNGFAQTNYNLAAQGCDTRNTINNTTRDIIDSQTAGTRAILDALNAQAIEAKNERINELTNQNNALRLAASQQAQNAYLVDQLRPSPIPAYTVANPYAGGCGCNGCCGNYA